jgi:5-methylcytosine-specific restriction endonuclease McrA
MGLEPDIKARHRKPISKADQLSVYRRDHWLCRWCGCPVIFAPAMKHLSKLITLRGVTEPLAYYHSHWTRRDAPLLDWLGAVIDHSEAHSRGGAGDLSNLVTACNKCNALKSAMPAEEFSKLRPLRPVKGKYGEPKDWDGLSTLFVVLVKGQPETASASDLDWLKHLKPSAI